MPATAWSTCVHMRWKGLEATRWVCLLFFFKAEAGIRIDLVTGVQTCALPISKQVQAALRPGEKINIARREAQALARDVDLLAGAQGRLHLLRVDAEHHRGKYIVAVRALGERLVEIVIVGRRRQLLVTFLPAIALLAVLF